jgi:acyl carrier protein
MQTVSDSDPQRWTLRSALREKRGWADAQIQQTLKESDPADRVELAMALEEEFGIQIEDDEFLINDPSDSKDKQES